MNAPNYRDRLAWDGRFLRVLDPAILTSVDRGHISHSTATAVQSCPARLVFDRLGGKETNPFAPVMIGGAVHKVLERLYNLPQAERTEEAAASILLDVAGSSRWRHLLNGDSVKTLQWTSTVMGNVKGDFAVEDPDQANVYATEFQAEATIDGLPILGFIDRIDVLDDATMRITDYKCGADRSKKPAPGFSDDHGDQIREYKVLLEHVLAERGELNPNGEPWRVSIGRDIYVTHGKQRRVSISKKSDIKRAMSKLRSGWDGLKQSVGTAMFECRVTPLCGWCPAVNSCPLAQAAGKVDRLGTALSADILAIPSLQMASTHTESDADHKVCPVVDGRRDAPCPTTTVAAEAPEETRDNDTTSKETTMSNLRSQTAPWREAKPWEGEFIDGHINMNGQCIQAAGVYTSTAINMLLENNLSTGPRSIKTLRDTLEMLTRRVQRQVTEGDDPSKGAAIRARFSVFSAIKVHPAPFGVTEPDLWSAWAEEVAKTAETLLRSDIASVEGRLPYEAQPWRELVHVKPRNPWNDPRPAATD